MGQYSIKEVETLSGVKAHTLRIWEQRYDFLKPHRTGTNIRYYTDEQLRLLLNIGTLNRNGMKISKIARLKTEDLQKEVLKVTEDTGVPDNLLDSLVLAMLDFDESRFEKTLSSAIMKLGFDAAFSQLVFPFMVRTGVLWAAGSVRVVQEHFISNLIRRKLSVAIDNQYVTLNENSRKFVLFLPEGETHELLLLFTEYILRKHHHSVTYLGASLPFSELEPVNSIFKPDYWVTYFTVPSKDETIVSFIAKMATAYPDQKVIVGGHQIDYLQPKLPANFFHVRSAQDLVSLIPLKERHS